MNNLAPQLNEVQIKQNLDALQKAGKTVQARQAYVDNYAKGPDGNYVLKTQQSTQPVPQNNAPTGFAPVDVIANTVRNAWGSVKQVGSGLMDVGQGLASSLVNPSDRSGGDQVAKGALEVSGGVGNTVASPVTGVIDTAKGIIDPAKKALTGETLDETAQRNIEGFVNKIKENPQVKQFLDTNPNFGENIQNAISTLFVVPGLKELTGLKLGETASDIGTGLKEKVLGNPEANAVETKAADLQSLKEKIQPKPTAKEAKLATEQGRLIKGKEPTLLKEGGPDQVLTSDQQFKSIQTVDRLIPDHAKLSEPELYTELKTKIADTAKSLKPEMEATPIKPETVKQITKDWEKIKTEQKSNAYTPSDVNVKKLQADFENRIQSSKSGNMNDLWETRQAYDDSVPDNVKKATSQSSESLQAKKDIWLQNRKVLSDAINNTQNGLGETSRQAFSDMRDMYEAKNGILSKAKIETTVAPSKLNQAIEKHPVLKTGVKVIKQAIPYGIGKHL